MTALNDLFPAADLATAIEAGHVNRRTHPTLPLSIYTYSRTVQYERAWTPVTTRCRGLIADDNTGEIVAWPFPKFFNVGEHAHGNDYAPPLPEGETFEVFDKVDGSLGIVFHYAGRWHAASKGSFISEQAQWAQHWLDSHDTNALWPDTTYLAEILYPANRIVVDYGDRQDLVLLGAFDRNGTEIRLAAASVDWLEIGNIVRYWPALPLADLLKLTEANTRPDGTPTSGISTEGYVIRYASGLRAKAKLAEYVRLHKVLTGITERDIWRMLGMQRFAGHDPKQLAQALGLPQAEAAALAGADSGPLDALLDEVPDEFDAWVRAVVADLGEQADTLTGLMHAAYDDIADLGSDRAAFARAAQVIDDRTVRAAMFHLLDGKPVDLLAWRAIKPVAADPFKNDEDN